MKALELLGLQMAPSMHSVFSFLAWFVVFIVVCVIVILGIRWVLAKAGWTPDPTLMTILGLIVFLVFFFMFLALVGVIPGWRG